jgi:FMN phosphatase YigB (HAD superfamily)
MTAPLPTIRLKGWSSSADGADRLDEATEAGHGSPQVAALIEARSLMAEPRKTVITFDVFDTFLFRRCSAPVGVFERAFHHLPIARRRPGLKESFVQNRIIAELRARQKGVAAIESSEVTIEEIYRCLPRQALALEDVTVAELVEAEFQAELDLCLVNPEMLQLAREALVRRVPLRLGFISDTYWSAAQLKRLLANCAPDLMPDFVYTSADHRTSKMATLFDRVTQGEEYKGAAAIHVGDNAVADILGARAFDISAVHYPQPQEEIGQLLAREEAAAQLMQSKMPDFSCRLDDGFHLLRRTALSQLPVEGAAYREGAAIFGPVIAGFQYFLRQRLDRIKAQGGKAAILFLGRDGHLPFELWRETQSEPAHYVEINRRVALTANLQDSGPLVDVFDACISLNEPSVQAFLRADLPSIRRYFAKIPGGIVDGKTFAAALPELLDGADIARLSQIMRDQLFAHLRRAVPDFDGYTDLVLVDMGYTGTIQRSLRSIFDQEGMTQRLHGVYLATVDERLVDLPEGDTVAGYIDGTVVTPATKLFLMRNIAVIEQIFSAPNGSVRAYEDGLVQHEAEIRPEEQRAFCHEIRTAAKSFARLFDAAGRMLKIDLGHDPRIMRDWSSLLLLRLLAFPSLGEQQTYGAMKHDVNLGTYLLFDMIDNDYVERHRAAKGFPAVMKAEAPPMWLSGSVTALSALEGCAYGMTAFGLSASALLADQKAADIQAQIVKNGAATACQIGCLVTADGALRLRVPLLARHMGGTLALPLATFLRHGLVRGLSLQRGEKLDAALGSNDIEMLEQGCLQSLHCRIDGWQFTALSSDAHLLVALPEKAAEVNILTITILPLPPVAEAVPLAVRGAA